MGASTSQALVRAAQVSTALLASLGLDGTLYPSQTQLKNNTSYDYIVVGGGTAGSIVASRLVEDHHKCETSSVLLLEAGDDPPISAILPGLFSLLTYSYVDYNYTSTYNPYSASSTYNRAKLTAGKMLGGTASLNYYVHTRGTPADYDYWAKRSRDDSWRYENITKYFKKSESIHDKEIEKTYPGYHGTKGPTGLTRELHPELNEYFQAFAEIGNPYVVDLNPIDPVGFTQPLYTVYNKVRQTPAITYVRNVKDYPNFYYSKKTTVSKIIFKGNVAVAVQAIYKGKVYILKARKEIIVSAGVFGTPKVLMLSGIGPQDHLKAMNIGVKRDLPVGNDLIDPQAAGVFYKTKKYLVPLASPKIVDVVNPTQIPFAILIGSVALNKSQTTHPDYRVYCAITPHDTIGFTLACANPFGLRNDICDSIQKQLTSRDGLVCFVTDTKPKSRGTVRLKSTDPFDKPKITMVYYNNKKDLVNMEKYVGSPGTQWITFFPEAVTQLSAVSGYTNNDQCRVYTL